MHLLEDLLSLLFHEVLEVVDVSSLRRDCYSFLVSGANHSIEHESFISGLAEAWEDKIAADHNTSASFSCFTVHCSYVLWILIQKGIHILAEEEHHVKGWRVMVIKCEFLRAVSEQLWIIPPLRAEIVHFVIVKEVFGQEPFDITHWITVEALFALGGKAHCDDVREDEAHVQVVPSLLVSILFYWDEALDEIPGLCLLSGEFFLQRILHVFDFLVYLIVFVWIACDIIVIINFIGVNGVVSLVGDETKSSAGTEWLGNANWAVHLLHKCFHVVVEGIVVLLRKRLDLVTNIGYTLSGLELSELWSLDYFLWLPTAPCRL